MQNELCGRLLTFALRVAKMTEALPRGLAVRNAADQVVRCSSSAASNYRASQRGRSTRDFLNKVAMALEEADETCFWLEYIEGLEVVPAKRLENLRTEADELVSILASIRKRSSG
ncbi:four helix bundle protein [Opitutales bacterium ASA1]|uniref:four helix bundle protein n=1 Tax=Congregicoccus parvus TaxID=3081749 RepID=UPI002B2B9A35|nr:four helix bundle protein [Opitutales bacterium ASA1]